MKRTHTLALMTTAATGVIVLVAGTGVAIGGALKPVNAAGQINACVQSQSGALRVANSTAECKAAELPLTWQQAASGSPILAKSEVETAAPMPYYTNDLNYTPQVIAEQTITIPAGERHLVKIVSATTNDFTMYDFGATEPPAARYGAQCGPAGTFDPETQTWNYPTQYPRFQSGFTTRIDGVQAGGFGTANGIGPNLLQAEHLLPAGTYRITVEAAPMHCHNLIDAGEINPAPTAQIIVFDQGRI